MKRINIHVTLDENYIVERDSTLPIHCSQVFSTAAPYQSSVEIHAL